MSKTKLMNKMFAVLLVFTFVAGLVSTSIPQTAYAAEDEINVDVKKLVSDIEDKDAKEAVLRLAAFKIIHGKEDGKYHPDDMVTREEFAKILVTSLKMDTAVKAGLGFTHFKDVEATRWSAGYIGIAAGQGLIKGYPDGTFKPANQVSYAEAITMLVRALGYKDEFLSGQWPANYLAKAGEKEITKKVKFTDAYGFANRGDVAIMVNNTLDAKVVKVVEYTAGATKYEERDVTLLEDKLNIKKLEDVRVLANKRIDDGLKEDEVRLAVPSEKKSKDSEEKVYDFINDVNPELVLGEEVNVYLNDDDEVIYLEKKNSDKVYFDYVKKAITKGDNIVALDLAKADDDFEFDEDAFIYVLDGDKYKNAQKDGKISLDDYSVTDFAGHVGKFVIKNRKIIYAEIMDMGEAYPWMVVFENKNGMLKGISADNDEFELDLTKDGNYDGVIVLDLEGYELDVEDIEKGNLVYAQKQSYDGDDYAVVRVVKDNIIEGKLERVQDNKVKVGNVERNVTHFTGADGKKVFDAYYSIDDGDEIKCFENNEMISDMDDADEEEVIAYTDAVGRIAYFVTAAEAASGYKYGIVKRVYADKDRIKVFTIADDGEDDDFIYRVEEEDNVKNPLVLNKYGQKTDKLLGDELKEGHVIKFKLNKDGEIAEDKLYVMPPEYLWKIEAKDDFGSDYLPKAKLVANDDREVKFKTDGKNNFGGLGIKELDALGETMTFSVDNNVTIIDAEKYKFAKGTKDGVVSLEVDSDKHYADLNEEDFAKGSWSELAKANGIDSYFYVFSDDTKTVNAKAVVFVGDASGSAANDEIAIYAIKKWYKGGDTYIDYVAYGEDKIESRIVDNADKLDEYLAKEKPFVAKVKSNGKLEIIQPGNNGETTDGFSILYGKIDSRKSDSLTLSTAVREGDNQKFTDKMFNISNKTVVYEEDNKKSTSNLTKDDVVLMVVENGTNVRVIERLIGSEKTAALKKIGEVDDTDGNGNGETGTVTYINNGATVTDKIELTAANAGDATAKLAFSVKYKSASDADSVIKATEATAKLFNNTTSELVETDTNATELLILKGSEVTIIPGTKINAKDLDVGTNYTLRIEIKVNGETISKDIAVVVKPHADDVTAVQNAMKTAKVAAVAGEKLDAVKTKVTLAPAVADGTSGVKVEWKSNADVVTVGADAGTAEATVVDTKRPAYGEAGKKVTLTVTISKGGYSETKDFEVTVAPKEPTNEDIAKELAKGLTVVNKADGKEIDLNAIAADIKAKELTYEGKTVTTSIKASSLPAIINAVDGKVTPSDKATEVILTLEVKVADNAEGANAKTATRNITVTVAAAN
ncbi:S-layer homology domain-containing protein [Tepidanaerobacter sp. EBM-38]|uniref:S-layer homology domain-containing protein n=1 Tax=Tepidanaerobacter sp. EBM-38 TaxID=1918496 RepID=UPI000AE36D45|nr:S-layer homology domain-containing protein [Tepidanaerobacter sp. EBM-38]